MKKLMVLFVMISSAALAYYEQLPPPVVTENKTPWLWMIFCAVLFAGVGCTLTYIVASRRAYRRARGDDYKADVVYSPVPEWPTLYNALEIAYDRLKESFPGWNSPTNTHWDCDDRALMLKEALLYVLVHDLKLQGSFDVRYCSYRTRHGGWHAVVRVKVGDEFAYIGPVLAAANQTGTFELTKEEVKSTRFVF